MHSLRMGEYDARGLANLSAAGGFRLPQFRILGKSPVGVSSQDSVGATAFGALHRQEGMRRQVPRMCCKEPDGPAQLRTPALRRMVIIGHQLVKAD